MPGAAHLHRPLKSSPRPKMPVEWTEELWAAFKVAKDSLQGASCVGFPQLHAELALMVDAFPEHVGASLQ